MDSRDPTLHTQVHRAQLIPPKFPNQPSYQRDRGSVFMSAMLPVFLLVGYKTVWKLIWSHDNVGMVLCSFPKEKMSGLPQRKVRPLWKLFW